MMMKKGDALIYNDDDDDDDDADIYLPLLRTHHGNTPAAIPQRG